MRLCFCIWKDFLLVPNEKNISGKTLTMTIQYHYIYSFFKHFLVEQWVCLVMLAYTVLHFINFHHCKWKNLVVPLQHCVQRSVNGAFPSPTKRFTLIRPCWYTKKSKSCLHYRAPKCLFEL